MTIEEAIKHAELKSNGTCVCRDYHKHVVKWLKELKDLREVVQNSVQPMPVVRDGNGKLTTEYTWLDWIAKLNEELDEAKYALYELEEGAFEDNFDEDEGFNSVAFMLQKLITVCTSMQQNYLNFDKSARNEICAKVNEINKQRGYFNAG